MRDPASFRPVLSSAPTSRDAVTADKVKPVWVRGYSDELGVDVARIVGYRVEWEDGTHGPTRKTMRGARTDAAGKRWLLEWLAGEK